jgi:hypothetical protein
MLFEVRHKKFITFPHPDCGNFGCACMKIHQLRLTRSLTKLSELCNPLNKRATHVAYAIIILRGVELTQNAHRAELRREKMSGVNCGLFLSVDHKIVYFLVRVTHRFCFLQKNTGQNGGKPKLDLNVEAAWAQGITGKNVTTAIMDDGEYCNKHC